MIGTVFVAMLKLINLGGSTEPGALRLRVVAVIVFVEDDEVNDGAVVDFYL